MAKRKHKKPEKLTEKQYVKLLDDLDSFDDEFFKVLANTDKYEVIPTVMEDGSFLTKEQYAAVKSECSRFGVKIVYQISLRNGNAIFINPENLKVGYFQEGMH